MKELSIKEKAKRYDEAIETAIKINSGEGVAAPSDWTICEVIFPEFKENEDEMVRKELFKHLKEGADGYEPAGNSEDYKRWLGWLEKQGEQKPTDVRTTGYWHVDDVEQKPTGSEEDERKIGDIRDAITLDDELEESYKEELYDFLKSLKERYTWKPSNEQMGALNDVMSLIDIKYDVLSELWKDLKKLKEE